MKKVILCATVSVAVSLLSSVCFADISSSIDNVANKLAANEAVYNTSVIKLTTLLESKERIDELKAQNAAFNKKAKVKEEKAISGETVKLVSQDLNNIDPEVIKSLSAEQKAEATDAAINILIANVRYASIASEVKAVAEQAKDIKGAAAMKMAGQLKTLKYVSTAAPEQASQAVSTSGAIVKLFSAAGIKLPDPASLSSSSEPKPVNLDF